ncbi:hypothetical protein N8T08_000678 [Aspergillus melleus]|uniref:Uncharacterized protein n=1 Tax=Aspergillus melleus TaxID=138277 RepID=A0ACC3AQ17_9EURO|nr:hypothetical protein N8T08_000678 [Aspergillus melleus]
MITPVHDYTSNIPFYAGDGSHPEPVPLPDVLPSNAPYILPTNVDIGISDLNHLSWTAELDQLSVYGLPTPGLEIPSIAKAPSLPFSDRQINHAQAHNFSHTQTQEWDLDSGSNTSSVDPRRTSITSIRAPITPPDYNVLDDPIPSKSHMRPLDRLSSSTYLQLLHDIEQTTALGHTHTVDSVLAANQRYLSTLLRMTETPGFEYGYDTHLLFTVALRKIIALFTAGYRDFVIRMEGPETCHINGINNYPNSHSSSNNVATGINGSGSIGVDRLIRFGVFEIDLVEQKAICRSILLRELKRARLCLIRLVDVLERDSGGCGGAGRHEGICEEMSRRLDLLVGSLEGE